VIYFLEETSSYWNARATDPKFILLDEPFAGVDPVAVEDIQSCKLKDKISNSHNTDHNGKKP
jgi:lipopolysaccharide export system ATP-binding protein